MKLFRPGLVADELLRITIVSYVAGAKGIFEFIRFDQAKPGILKKLGRCDRWIDRGGIIEHVYPGPKTCSKKVAYLSNWYKSYGPAQILLRVDYKPCMDRV